MLRGKSRPSFDSLFDRSRNLSTRGQCQAGETSLYYRFKEIFLFGTGYQQMEHAPSTINEFKGKLTKIRNNKMGFL